MPANTPKLALPYPLATDQVSEGASDIQALAVRLEAVLAPAILTAIPPAPFVGQRVLFAPAAGLAPWELVYDGTLWHYLGGAPLQAFAAARVHAGGAYVASGPTVHLPLVGTYDLSYGALWDGFDGDGGHGFASPSATGLAPSDTYAQTTQTGHSYGGWTPFLASGLATMRTPAIGGDVALAFKSDGGLGAGASNRTLWARPVSLTGTAAAALELEREA